MPGRLNPWPVNDRFWRWSQRVDATPAANLSSGDLTPKVFLGRSFNCQATLLRYVRGYIDRLVPFEKHCLNRPLVFSLEPRRQLTYDPRLLFRGELSAMCLTRKQKIQCIRLR